MISKIIKWIKKYSVVIAAVISSIITAAGIVFVLILKSSFNQKIWKDQIQKNETKIKEGKAKNEKDKDFIDNLDNGVNDIVSGKRRKKRDVNKS